MTSPEVCRRCAERGTACCISPYGVSLAPLTTGDLRRIERRTGLPREAFTSTRELDPIERDALWTDDPVLRGLGSDGRLVSLRIVDERCVFLGKEGCSLGEDRPLLCRRFPFVRQGRSLQVRPGGECLACEEAADLPELMHLLQIDEDELRRLDRRLRADLRPADRAPPPPEAS